MAELKDNQDLAKSVQDLIDKHILYKKHQKDALDLCEAMEESMRGLTKEQQDQLSLMGKSIGLLNLSEKFELRKQRNAQNLNDILLKQLTIKNDLLKTSDDITKQQEKANKLTADRIKQEDVLSAFEHRIGMNGKNPGFISKADQEQWKRLNRDKNASIKAEEGAKRRLNNLTEKKLVLTQHETDLSAKLTAGLKERTAIEAEENSKLSFGAKVLERGLNRLTNHPFLKGLGLDNHPRVTKLIEGLKTEQVLAFIAIEEIIKFGVKTFLKFDEALFTLRKNFGLLRGQNIDIETIAKSVAKEYAGIGVTIEQSVAAVTELGKSFGLSSTMTKEIVANVAAFSAQFGIAEQTSAAFLKTMATVSGKTLKEASVGMMGFAQSMSAAAGTNLTEVMSDIAHASDSVRSTFRGNTVELIKATVEARRLGLSLDSMGKTAESLLDFNSSVNAEMEASVLLGRNINLMEARRKAFVGDLKGVNDEILKVLKSVGEFNKMPMFQKKALAQATGKTVEDLQTMLQRAKDIEEVEAHGSAKARRDLDIYKKLTQLSEEEAKNTGKTAENAVLKMANQARWVALQQKFNQLMMELSGPVMDLTESILDLANLAMPLIIKAIQLISYGIKGIASIKFIPMIKEFFTTFKLFAVTGSKFFEAFTDGAKAAFGVITSLGTKWKWLGSVLSAVKIFKPFLKFAGWIGVFLAVIDVLKSAFGSLVCIIDRFSKAWDHAVKREWSATFLNLRKAVVTAFLTIPKIIVDVIGGSIYDLVRLVSRWFGTELPEGIWDGLSLVADWMGGIVAKWWHDIRDWLGNSPSVVGLSIVNGITSVGGMLFDALVSPFKLAWDFIESGFKRIPEMIMSVFKKGMDFVMQIPGAGFIVNGINALISPEIKNDQSVTDKRVNTETVESSTNQIIVDKLDELIKLMKSGGIAVNIDGRKMSSALANASY